MSYIANSVNEGKDVYLVDLGNDHNRWMEVKQWKAKGCKATRKVHMSVKVMNMRRSGIPSAHMSGSENGGV